MESQGQRFVGPGHLERFSFPAVASAAQHLEDAKVGSGVCTQARNERKRTTNSETKGD